MADQCWRGAIWKAEVPHDFSAGIGRSIVDDDDLVGLNRLSREGRKSLLDKWCRIVHWYDHGKLTHVQFRLRWFVAVGEGCRIVSEVFYCVRAANRACSKRGHQAIPGVRLNGGARC